MNLFSEIGKNFAINHNVAFNVYDAITHKLKRHYEGHNSVTNSMLTGIGHYLIGDGTLNQGWDMLRMWIPRYISLGTMGLRSQHCDEYGLPTDLGSIKYDEGETPNFEEDCKDYMSKIPGFGADGYDANANHGREWFGLGPQFPDRPNNGWFEQEFFGLQDAGKTEFPLEHKVYTEGGDVTAPHVYISTDISAEPAELEFGTDYTFRDETDSGHTYSVLILLSGALENDDILKIRYFDNNPLITKSVDCELISPKFQRVPISYRTIIPEVDAEMPNTVDVVFSAMISTGALKQFRDYTTINDDQIVQNDYIFITEAGLWSSMEYKTRLDLETNKYIPSGGGLLAAYRIAPPNESNWDMTVESNRKLLQQSILRVGYNEVVQVVWKIQLGSISDFGNNTESLIIAQANQILEDAINSAPS